MAAGSGSGNETRAMDIRLRKKGPGLDRLRTFRPWGVCGDTKICSERPFYVKMAIEFTAVD